MILHYLIPILIFTAPAAVIYYFLGGLLGGFRFLHKIPPELVARLKKVKVYVLPIFGFGAIGSGILAARGCVNLPRLLQPGEIFDVNVAKEHSLGKLAPPDWKLLHRLRQADIKRVADMLRREQADKEFEARLATQQFVNEYQLQVLPNPDGSLINVASLSHMSIATRQGPACHVTCYAHHGAQYDRETLPEYCTANWIPPKLEWMPGWYPISDTEEITMAWPGPATPGFHSYKLYWEKLEASKPNGH